MTAKDPTKHHYIPQFYLANWTGGDCKFERYTKPVPRKIMVKRVFPSEAGWQPGLYASPGDRLGAQWLETKIFQAIDSRAALALRKMVAEPPQALTAADRSAWTLFLRSLLHRTPETLQGTVANAMSMIDAAIEDAREQYPALKGPTDPETFDAFKAAMTLDERRRIALKALPSLIGNPRIGQFLHDMATRVFTLPEGTRDFLLSDAPLARTNGLKKEDGHIAIPLSPRKLFVSAYRESLLDQLANMKPNELVANTNKWTVESAQHFVAARDRSQDQFIRNRFGRDPKPPLLRI